MIELERTYLAKKLPRNLGVCQFQKIIDIYFPKDSKHPKIRLRKIGNKVLLSKKSPINTKDYSRQKEETIILSKKEFDFFKERLEGKKIYKLRYYYNYQGRVAEFDIFQDQLLGLVLIDFEFSNLEDKKNFRMPNFCLCEVSSKNFIAAGILSGQTYRKIENDLKKYKYKKLFIN